jgi:hypothetical protein
MAIQVYLCVLKKYEKNTEKMPQQKNNVII